MKTSIWWWFSTVVSAVLIFVLIQLWSQMNRYEIDPTQLVDSAAVDSYLMQNWESIDHAGAADDGPLIKIPTGIFIQSLKFFNSTEVNLSGYIWQRYSDGVHDALKPAPGVAGFILPEQVQSGDDVEPREVYRIRQGDEEVIGWYFEATLRQPFDYFFYPFDHKTVWVRMWPQQFARNVVLVPDFSAYRATGLSDVFGIENEIVLGAWERENTFFDFKPTCYDTNFGIKIGCEPDKPTMIISMHIFRRTRFSRDLRIFDIGALTCSFESIDDIPHGSSDHVDIGRIDFDGFDRIGEFSDAVFIGSVVHKMR